MAVVGATIPIVIQASRVSCFWLERNVSWGILGQKVSTTSTRSQESNKQNREFTEESYGWVSRKVEKYQKLQGSIAPKGQLKARGIPVSNKTIKRTGRTDELSGELGECEYIYAYS